MSLLQHATRANCDLPLTRGVAGLVLNSKMSRNEIKVSIVEVIADILKEFSASEVSFVACFL